jgi:sterol desaturase/sphingolipid hydroxylase (fatty acid hydroxylase superfamily)
VTPTTGVDLWLRPLLFVALAALAFLPLERVVAAHARPRRRFATDVAFAVFGQLLVRVGLVFVVGWLLARLDDVAIDRSLSSYITADRGARAVLDVVVGLGLFELAGYGYHRLAHRVPCLWRLHEIHHSSETMDWLASFRQHPLEILLMTLAQNAPLVLLGIPLGAHAAVLALLKLATVFVHANLRVPEGPWTLVVATPRFHHRHHQLGGAVRNYASLFPFIDVLFGTYTRHSATTFGVPRALPGGFVALLVEPLRSRLPWGAASRAGEPAPPAPAGGRAPTAGACPPWPART